MLTRYTLCVPNNFMKSIAKSLRLLWQDGADTGSRFIRGSTILVIGRITIKAVYFIKTIILARILFPEDFGLFGLAALSMGVLDTLFQPGFYSALIHEKGDIKPYLNAVWVGAIARNTIIASLVIVCAPLLGAFFENDNMIPLARSLAISVFIAGFENVGIVYFVKDLQFNRKFLLDVTIVITEIVCVIIAALILRNAWALVVGSICNRIAAIAYSYLFHPYRPKFTTDLKPLLHLFRFGKWMSVSSITSYAVSQGDNFTVGKMLGTTSLGYYQSGFALALIPVAEFGRVLGNALFPMFSGTANHTERQERFFRVTRIIFAFIIPTTFGLYALAPELVRVIYGERWMPMAPIVAVLALYAMIKSFEVIGQPYVMGMGLPHLSATSTMVQIIFMIIFLPPLIVSMGVVGAGWAMVISGAGVATVYAYAMIRHGGIHPGALVTMIFPSFSAGLIMAKTQQFVLMHTFFRGAFGLLANIFFGALVYLFFLWIFDRTTGGKTLKEFLWIKNKIHPAQH